MADREKMIELIRYARYEVEGICDERDSCDDCPAENWCKDGYIADHLIANGVVVSNLETTTRWIPVTERLPEEPLQTVIVTNGAESCVAVYSVVYDEFAVMCGKGRGQDKWFGVTHWMPLPEPPKGG